MISLVFDTETTGKYHKSRSLRDPSQPALVEIAIELYSHDLKKVVTRFSSLVKPLCPISDEAKGVHGISQEVAEKFGQTNRAIVAIFGKLLESADRIVCHNVNFDLTVMQIAYIRDEKKSSDLLKTDTLCTMEATTDLLKLPGKLEGKYKWPSLDEAYRALVDPKGFPGAHGAAYDTKAARMIMMKLEEKK